MHILTMNAILPVKVNGLDQTLVLEDDGTATLSHLTLSRYVNSLSRQMGVSVTAQQRDKKRRRGIAVCFGFTPENIYIRVKIPASTDLAYVNLHAIRSLFADTDGCCTLTFPHCSLHTAWRLRTVAKHLEDAASLTTPLTLSLTAPTPADREEMRKQREAVFRKALEPRN